MKKISLLTLTVSALLMTLNSASVLAVDFEKIEADLKGDGAIGWIHGSIPGQEMFVFTVRNPKDFFDYAQLSLLSFDSEIVTQLKSFRRHDKVRIKGEFLKNRSAQKHIEVRSIELVDDYESPYPNGPYSHTVNIPDELAKKTSARFLVHAVGAEGRILVVEYQDAVIPVYVKKPEFTKSLYRNDLVELHYTIQRDPHSPMHLKLDTSVAEPVKMIQSIQGIHDQPAEVQGRLILFPKSPEISLNVFAVEEVLPNGAQRQYTIVNFEDMDVFQKLYKKLQARWDAHPGEYVNGRNKLISKAIQVRVKGVFNLVSASQANPQILVPSIEAVTILE